MELKNYRPIPWMSNEKRTLVRISTPADGSCLFHAIINACFEPYRSQKIGEETISSRELVLKLRKELAELLPEKRNEKETWYSSLNNGNNEIFSQSVPEFSLANMQHELDSHQHIGYGYLELIGEVLNKDIYILNHRSKKLYISD